MTTVKPRTIPLSKRSLNFEMIMWTVARLSALAIYALIIAGLIGALIVSAQIHANFGDVLRWAFFPNTTANPLSAMPWISLLAKLMVTALVIVVSAHAIHGIIEILDDYVTAHLWRHGVRHVGGVIFFLITTAIAIYVIWTS
jgi:succinate dehydrogenase hydrophobic anchor subunit